MRRMADLPEINIRFGQPGQVENGRAVHARSFHIIAISCTFRSQYTNASTMDVRVCEQSAVVGNPKCEKARFLLYPFAIKFTRCETEHVGMNLIKLADWVVH
jgi:hypothetical protein